MIVVRIVLDEQFDDVLVDHVESWQRLARTVLGIGCVERQKFDKRILVLFLELLVKIGLDHSIQFFQLGFVRQFFQFPYDHSQVKFQMKLARILAIF